MEAFRESIRDKLYRMQENRKKFTENELWNIADSIIPPMAHLQTNGISTFKIDTDNIFIMPNGKIVLNPLRGFQAEFELSDKRKNPFKDDLY